MYGGRRGFVLSTAHPVGGVLKSVFSRARPGPHGASRQQRGRRAAAAARDARCVHTLCPAWQRSLVCMPVY